MARLLAGRRNIEFERLLGDKRRRRSYVREGQSTPARVSTKGQRSRDVKIPNFELGVVQRTIKGSPSVAGRGNVDAGRGYMVARGVSAKRHRASSKGDEDAPVRGPAAGRRNIKVRRKRDDVQDQRFPVDGDAFSCVRDAEGIDVGRLSERCFARRRRQGTGTPLQSDGETVSTLKDGKRKTPAYLADASTRWGPLAGRRYVQFRENGPNQRPLITYDQRFPLDRDALPARGTSERRS